MNIVFHSTISKVDNKYYIKDVFYKYLKGLCKEKAITLITPVSNKRGHFHTKEIDFKGLIIKSIPNNPIKKTRFLYQCFSKSDFTLIFMPTITGALSAFILLIKKKKYILYFGTDWVKIEKDNIILSKGKLDFFNKLKLQAISFIDRNISKKAKLILVTGGQLKEKYSKLNSNVVNTKPIINISNSVLKLDVHKEKNKFNVLFVGKIAKAKGIFDLLDCIKNFNSHNSIYFTIVGDGPDLQELKELIKLNKLDERVKTLGYIKNGPKLFKEYMKADAFVLPSYFEGFPRVFYEAMRFDVPIITTPVNSIPYLLNENETALFIKVGDPKSIEDVVTKLYNDKDLQEKLRNNGKQLVKAILDEPAWRQHLRLTNSL